MSLAVHALSAFRRFAGTGRRAEFWVGLLKGLTRAVPIRRAEVMKALSRSFPEMSEVERKVFVRRLYEHFCWMMVEWVTVLNHPSLLSEVMMVDEGGLESLKALADRGQGAVLLGGHLGHWELLAARLVREGIPMRPMAREADDSSFSQLIDGWRSELGVEVVAKGLSSLRSVLRLPQQGVLLGLVADQDAGREGLPVTFLGQRGTMVRGPATIALTARVPLIPVFSWREGPMKHRLTVGEPIEVPAGLSRSEQVDEMTRRANDVIDAFVRRHPEQWFWFHRRWKSGRYENLRSSD